MANKSFIGTTGTTWNNAASWSNGTLPVNGDTLFCNNKNVMLDSTFNQPLSSFSNAAGTSDAGAGITAGGTFVISENVTALAATAAAAVLMVVNTAATATVEITTVTGGTSASAYGFSISTVASNITFNNSTFVGGSATNAMGLAVNIANTTVVFANCTATGGTNTSAFGVYTNTNNTMSGTLSLTQSATSTVAAFNVSSSVTNAITLSGAVVHRNSSNTGLVSGGTLNYTMTSEVITGTPVPATGGLWQASASGILNIVRPAGSLQMHSGNGGSHYIYISGSVATITCVGDITCGTGAGTYVAYANGAGSGYILIDGTVTGPTATVNQSGMIAIVGATVIVKHLARNASGGQLPCIVGNVRMMVGSTIVASTDSSTVTLVDATESADVPSAADVRSGTSYASGALTGTAAIPAAGSVALGVAVDATVGTAVLRAEDIPSTLIKTTIATLASQTSFTLTAGSSDNDAYNGATIVITDASTANQKAAGTVLDYVGSTKTITLSADPAIFTMAAGDTVAIFAGASGGGGDATAENQTTILSRLPTTLTANGNMKSSVLEFITTAINEGAVGRIAAAWQGFWNVVSPVATAQTVNQTGDAFSRIGAPAGASIAADIAAAKSDLTTLLSRITAARAGYLDNLNVGGPVSSQADVLAINQSASRRVILTTLQQFERPESGSTPYTLEMRTYDDDGAAVNADSTPAITVTGTTTGSLAANVGTVSNPETGLYRWVYSQQSNATLEPIRADVSPTLNGSQYPMSVHSQSLDFVAATWSTTDSSNLTAIFNKMPSRGYLTGSSASTGAAVPADLGLASGNLDTQLGEKATAAALAAVATTIGTPAGASVSADIAAVKSDTGTLVGRVTTTVVTLWSNLTAMISGSAGTAAFTETAMANAPAGGGGPGGGNTSILASYPMVERSPSDDKAITFSWPTADATVTANVSIDNADYIPVTGEIEFLRTDSGVHLYTLAFDAADRPNGEGTARYQLTDGDETTYFTLRVVGSGVNFIEDAQALVITPIRPGGAVVLKAGDDYETALVTQVTIPIQDPSLVAYNRLTDSSTASVQFGATRTGKPTAATITGTASKAAVTESGGVTYVPVEIPASQLPNTKVASDYRYDIQVTTSGGKKITVCEAALEVVRDNAV